MPIDVNDVLTRGGGGMLEFLHYCVYTRALAPVFVLLARDYRFRPTISAAICLHEVFCAANAPARIDAPAVLFPGSLRLDQMIERLRCEQAAYEQTAAQPADPHETVGTGWRPPPLPNPAMYLFDPVVEHLVRAEEGAFYAPGRAFDPRLTAMENLPGGTLSAGQRAFVDNVWRRSLRPALVAAGLWRAASIGQ